MSEAIPTPEKIWIITGEAQTKETLSGARDSSRDTGELLGSANDIPVMQRIARIEERRSALEGEGRGK